MYYRMLRLTAGGKTPFQAFLTAHDGRIVDTTPGTAWLAGKPIGEAVAWAKTTGCAMYVRDSGEAEWTRFVSCGGDV